MAQMLGRNRPQSTCWRTAAAEPAGPATEPAGLATELAGVPDLVVRRVEPDLPAAGPGAARGPGEHGETGPGQVFGFRGDRVPGLPEPGCEQDRREPSLAGRGEEAGVEHHVLVIPRA